MDNIKIIKEYSSDSKDDSDSQIVLSWLQQHPSRWKTFVANRTSAILECMSSKQWHFVNTKLNLAGIASRGILSNELIIICGGTDQI